MKLQDWFNDNMPDEDLIYREGMIAQVIWVRDGLAYMVWRSLSEKYSDLADYEQRQNHLVVENTHRSKSVILPVYHFKIDDISIKIRCNFHDWCVRINGIDVKASDIPTWMNVEESTGYFEGMERDEAKLSFCVQTREQVYAILWWILNERII